MDVFLVLFVNMYKFINRTHLHSGVFYTGWLKVQALMSQVLSENPTPAWPVSNQVCSGKSLLLYNPWVIHVQSREALSIMKLGINELDRVPDTQ
jgi:hypothetical protein